MALVEEKRIKEIKQKTKEIRLKANEEKLAKLQKTARDKGIVLDDEKDCIPLNIEQQQVIARYEERTKEAKLSSIVYKHSFDGEGKLMGGIETIDGNPLSATDMFKLYSATLNEATRCSHPAYGYQIFMGCYKACSFYSSDKHKGSNMTITLEAMRAMKPQDEYEGQLCRTAYSPS